VATPVVSIDLVDTMFKFMYSSISSPCSNATTCDQALVNVTTRDYNGNVQTWGPISTATATQSSSNPNSLSCNYDGSVFSCKLVFLAPVNGYIQSIDLTVRVLGNTVNALEYTFYLGNDMPISQGMIYTVIMQFIR
jgi:hypothetical protein